MGAKVNILVHLLKVGCLTCWYLVLEGLKTVSRDSGQRLWQIGSHHLLQAGMSLKALLFCVLLRRRCLNLRKWVLQEKIQVSVFWLCSKNQVLDLLHLTLASLHSTRVVVNRRYVNVVINSHLLPLT